LEEIPPPNPALETLVGVFPREPVATCVVADKALAWLRNARYKPVVNPACIRCQKHGRPAYVSLNSEDVVYYICERCHKP